MSQTILVVDDEKDIVDLMRYNLVQAGFRVVSAGADGKFDATTWGTAAKQLPFDADAVVTNEGRWLVRSWELQ